MSDVSIRLDSVTDWPGFSRAVRALRAEGAAPEAVRWWVHDAGDAVIADLFDGDVCRRPADMADAPALSLPRAFVEAAREVFLHADPQRLPLLHRLVLRIADDPQAWVDPLHADRLQFERYLREVRREIHKMHAFVRFRRLAPSGDAASCDAIAAAPGQSIGTASSHGAAWPVQAHGAEVRHVAWFEPSHHVLEAAAPFFARRFATLQWAILTPRASVQWDGRALSFGPGARREDAPAADAGEALWLAYYRSIFNPARVKVAMMKKEMPVRFWKNLPEATAIPALLRAAPERQRTMVAVGGVERSRRRAARAAAQVAESPPPGPQATGEGGADPLERLARQAAHCRDCPGAHAATQTVFGQGSAAARVMIVGEQPGDQEDLRGLPFQGPAGQLLRAAMHELGWPTDAVYLTNAVKHFHHELRGKRRIHKTPGQQEALACLHWLEAEIDALRPRSIVALGATAARSLLGPRIGVTAHEGHWLSRPDGIRVLVCRHPAAILRADPSRQAAMRAQWVQTLREASMHVLSEAAHGDAGDGLPGRPSAPEPIAA